MEIGSTYIKLSNLEEINKYVKRLYTITAKVTGIVAIFLLYYIQFLYMVVNIQLLSNS